MPPTVRTATISHKDVAHLINLNPKSTLQDALMVIVDRARITNGLSAKILDSVHILTLNFGHIHDQENGEIRSRLIAPVSTRLTLSRYTSHLLTNSLDKN